MQKKIFSKILSTIVVLSLILSVFIPMGNIIGVAAEAKESDYSSAFNNVDAIKADGWSWRIKLRSSTACPRFIIVIITVFLRCS